MNKLIIKQHEFKGYILDICRQIQKDNFKPDYVVGISRGGLIPAVMISHYLDIPMHTLEVSLRDGGQTESILWMSEEAFGYPKKERFVSDENNIGAVLDAAESLLEQGDNYKNILLVDDINDSGATFNWIMNDWQSSCLPNDPDWQHVWNNNVKFAVIVNNQTSECSVPMDYVGFEINKFEKDVWIEFPYEEWWKK